MDHFEVIIVGGGPAGSSVAHRLGQKSSLEKILLIESREGDAFHNYHHMCGEGISSKGLAENDIDCSDLIKNHVNRAVERWPGGITLSNDIDGLVIDRNKLIARLRKPLLTNGGEVRTGRIHSVRRIEGRYLLRCENEDISCDYLVGADGAHSLVRRELFGSEPPTYMNVVQYLVDESMDSQLVFDFDERYRGKYRWEFPSGKMMKIGFPVGTYVPPSHPLEVHQRAIPIGPLKAIVDGRACLVGDAASQVNPVTFGGIRNALTAGRMAADAILVGDLKLYQDHWSRSPQADPCFYDSYLRLRDMSNTRLQELVEPFRFGPHVTAIMRGLMNDQDFRTFYRSHVRKLENGW